MRMLFRRLSHTGLLLCVALGVSSCGEKKTELGEGGSVVTGSAGPQSELRESGVLRPNSTVAKGRGYEAQYTLTPSLTFSESDAGRGLAGIMGMIPVLRDLAGLIGLAEQVKFKEAQTALLLSDNETTEQVAAATGAARTTDLGIGGIMIGRLGGASGAGWSNTNEAKVVAAAFLDTHNALVEQVRALQAKPLPPPVPSR